MFRLVSLWSLAPAVAVIIWGELTPHPPSELNHVWDKAEHFTAYFGLALMAVLARGRAPLGPFFAILALGGALEMLQGLTGRDPDIHDMLANTIGALAGLGLALLLLRQSKPAALVDPLRRD